MVTVTFYRPNRPAELKQQSLITIEQARRWAKLLHNNGYRVKSITDGAGVVQ